MPMLSRAALGLSALCVCAAPALAQTPTGLAIVAPSGSVPVQAGAYAGSDGKAVTTGVNNPLPTWSGYSSATPLPIGGAAKTAGRALMTSCSAAGSATITMSDGSTVTIALPAGVLAPLPLAVTGVSAGPAGCSFYSLASAALPNAGAIVATGTLDFSDPTQSAFIL